MEDVRARVARNIKALRKQKGLSQEELGGKAGLHRNYIGYLERCTKDPTVTTIEKLALALGVPAGSLLD